MNASIVLCELMQFDVLNALIQLNVLYIYVVREERVAYASKHDHLPHPCGQFKGNSSL